MGVNCRLPAIVLLSLHLIAPKEKRTVPIQLENLEESEKAHVAVKGSTPWAMAAAALKQRGGNPSWPLVVRKSDGSYAAATFDAILKAGDLPPDTPAEALPGLVPVKTLDVNSMGVGVARDEVQRVKELKLYVLMDGEKFVGALSAGMVRGGELPTAKLNELAGKQTDLTKLGDFLLDEA